MIWRLQAPRKIHKNVASFLKAKAKNKFLNTNVFSTVKKCKRGMWGKLKGIATLSGWHSLENWRIFQVDTVLKIDASFRLTQSWKLTQLFRAVSLKRVNSSYRQYHSNLIQRNEEFLGWFFILRDKWRHFLGFHSTERRAANRCVSVKTQSCAWTLSIKKNCRKTKKFECSEIVKW